MKKRIVKMIPILFAVIAVLMVASAFAPVFAAGAVDPGTIKPNTDNTGQIQNVGKRIVGIVQVVGTIVSVLMLIALGIKYMLGSAEEKAEYKKTMIPYLIGAILIFAASNIASAIYNFANQITTS